MDTGLTSRRKDEIDLSEADKNRDTSNMMRTGMRRIGEREEEFQPGRKGWATNEAKSLCSRSKRDGESQPAVQARAQETDGDLMKAML